MITENLPKAFGRIFNLKSVLFNTFDIGPLALEINKTQERVLMMCHHHPLAQMSFLSREAGLEKGSLTTVIDSLESAGLVERVRDENDGRAIIIQTTAAGKKTAAKIEALFRAHLDALLGALSPNDRAEFERAIMTLDRLIPELSTNGEKK
jgi:DNA-binding MarR family transcriptional regulator